MPQQFPIKKNKKKNMPQQLQISIHKNTWNSSIPPRNERKLRTGVTQIKLKNKRIYIHLIAKK